MALGGPCGSEDSFGDVGLWDFGKTLCSKPGPGTEKAAHKTLKHVISSHSRGEALIARARCTSGDS